MKKIEDLDSMGQYGLLSTQMETVMLLNDSNSKSSNPPMKIYCQAEQSCGAAGDLVVF
jgi:hypothetical protein